MHTKETHAHMSSGKKRPNDFWVRSGKKDLMTLMSLHDQKIAKKIMAV